MPPTPSSTRRRSSVWRRFWSPDDLLESVPAHATAEEAEEIRHRNNVWLKTYLDIYIWRRAIVAIVAVFLFVFTWDWEGSVGASMLGWAALALTIAAFVGLARMIRVYRQAAEAVRVNGRRGPRP